jgi:ABC-2 type transport system permease protein
LRSSERFRLLLGKDWQELLAARAWWLFLAACGILVGHAYLTAVTTYAEVSGGNGGPAALAQGVSPLDGFVVPVLGAYAIAATLLLPFVAIRLLSAEKDGGGLGLMLQGGVRPIELVASKFVVSLAGWAVALLPAAVAFLLWRVHGGHLDGGEVAVVLLGHLLRAMWTIAVALAAAAFAESASTAAILTLGVTLATWALDFVAAVQGGMAQRFADLTPESVLRVFERGELSASVVLVGLVVTLALLVIAAHGLRAARLPRRALLASAVTIVGAAVAIGGAGLVRASADLSEDRRNSFSPADERALALIHRPIDVEVHLAPEDPRLADLERSVLRKLRRAAPRVAVRAVAVGSSGLFAADSAYGEVWYAVGGRRAMSRSTTPAIVLETIYAVAGVKPPTPENEPAYPGYPLVLRDRVAPYLFYLAWPLLVLAAWRWTRRPPAPSEPVA